MNILILIVSLQYLLFLTSSTGYILTFTLKPANIAEDLDLTLSSSTDNSLDSLEQIFEIPRPDSVLYNPRDPEIEPTIDLGETPSPLSGLSGIAGRILTPPKTFHPPIADYSGRLVNSRRLSQILADASGAELLRGASQQSRVSQEPEPTLDLVPSEKVSEPIVIGRNIPPNSNGRCFEFNAPEIGLLLHSMSFSNFADEDDVPVGIKIFSQPECTTNRGFIGYKDLEIDKNREYNEVDLSRLEEPVSDVFSAMPVYESPYGGITDLLTNEEVVRDIGSRPAAPNVLNTPKRVDIGSDESLLVDPEKPNYWTDFDVPWRGLEEIGSVEEEEKTTTPGPLARNQGGGNGMYFNPLLQAGKKTLGTQSLNGSPRNLKFQFADSDKDSGFDPIRPSDWTFNMGQRDDTPPDAYLASLDIFNTDENLGGDSATFLDESVYGPPPLWQINQQPELADLESWQYPYNRGKASSEDKGI
ncbi:hypothetical protein TWF694_004547 [Orbilia ellipsospora]|uniref:Uncharacterized protein n=1 Tax=Orbilia ellipsospora TaxID=2528407 RepID=A0AAV9WVH8_9PEZI